MATRAQRLGEFMRRLSAAPAARSFDEARGLIDRTLNEVEDEFSGIAYNPQRSKLDGRLYPPFWDNVFRGAPRPGIWTLRSARHLTYVGENGAIAIDSAVARLGGRVLDKAGADGRRVDDR